MTIKFYIFLAYLIMWLTFGIFGELKAKDNRTNWELSLFILLLPTIAIFAYFAGITG